ncbi:hypothetical protein SLEP1_g29941 [Rubroshorea leprosula]|uniref:Uncharacterized protein n=1 Tax=Rubroshorea leprosula TaxID=152421 RepID=A0AAV5K4D1_9ROSI|nr:hypothetical protein SLEP1_g29941 [Rubroshorea leprosula]
MGIEGIFYYFTKNPCDDPLSTSDRNEDGEGVSNLQRPIKAKIDAANKAVSKIGEHMTGQSGGGSASGGAQGGGDQTPEAEYEEVKK